MKHQARYGGRPRGSTSGPIVRLLVLFTLIAGATAAPARAGEPCPNAQARSESAINAATGGPYSTQLPDCRAYELVSPPDTGGIPAVSLDEASESRPRSVGAEWDQVTPDGALYWFSRAQPAGTGAVPNGTSIDVFVSRRAAGGWTTRDLTPFSTIGENELIAGAADGSAALIVTQTSLVPEDQDNPLNSQGDLTSTFDIYRVSEGAAPQLVSHGPLPRTVPPHPAEEGIVLDQARNIAYNAPLTAVAFVSTARLTEEASAGFKDCYAWSDVGARLASLTNREERSTENRNCELLGMTPDGRPIFRDLSADSYSGLIFVGNGPEFPSGKVSPVQLSAPASTATTFNALSPDGSLAYVTTAYPLGSEERAGEPNVYAVTVPALPHNTLNTPRRTAGVENSVVCLSCQVVGGGAATFAGQSPDGSHVFLNVAEATGEPPGHPYKGLWSWDRNTKTASRLTEATDVEQLISSENGQYAAGLTTQLAGNPNATADVYELTVGQAPRLITSGGLPDTYRLNVSISPFSPPTVGSVANDGQRVVYDDKPRGESLETIREWSRGETVQLSPLGAASSYYVLGAAGAQLEDVFFAAHEPLISADRNGGTQDVYDARVQGGFPPCTAGNPNPPRGSSSCTPPTSTPNPQAPSPLPYTASLGPAAFSLPPLPADSSHPASQPKPLSCQARARKISNAKQRTRALKRCVKKSAKKTARRRSRDTGTGGGPR